MSAPPGYTKGLNPIAGSQTVGQTRIPGYSHPSSYAVPLSITYGFLVSQYSKLTAPVVQLGVSDPSQVESLTYNVQFIAPKDFKLNVQATLINKQVCSGSVLVTDRKSTMQLNCK